MKASYENDRALGPGYGLLVVSGAEAEAGERLGFCIRRSSDGRFLGRCGWQDAEEPLWPDEVRSGPEGALVLAVAPAVVNQLDELDPCRFSLYREGTGSLGACTLQMAGILYGDMSAGGNVATAPAPVAPKAPESVVETTQPVADPLPELQPTPVKKGGLGWLVALLAGLGLLALGAWLWFSAGKPATPPQPTPPAAEEPAKDKAPQPEPAKTEPAKTEPAKAEPAAPEPKLSPKERVRTFLKQGGTPDAAVALSRELPKDSVEGQDAVFLLLEVAAEGGNGASMLEVARYYDPLSPAPAGTLQKDPEQAWNWYVKAAGTAGDVAAEAGKALDALTAWLKEQAGRGEAGAEALLKRLKR